MRRSRKRGLSYFQAGLLTLVIVSIGTYLGFAKSIPFRSHYEIKAVFQTANNLKPNSLVRIAGVNVGKVTKVEHVRPGEEAAVVTLRFDKRGLPIHKDAEIKIRPRIFLEGNFFVDVKPGSPSAPTLGDGDTLPINQTSSPVQLDQLLTALQADTRKDLRVLLQELSTALSGKGGQGYNRSIPFWKPAYRDSAIVNDATLGLLEHDLSGYVKGAGKVAEALDRNSQQLKSLVTDFNTTAAAFAREDTNLQQAIAELPRTLRAAEPALASLNASFPPVRRLIRDFRPGVRSSGPTIDASLPFVKQARRLVSASELKGLAAKLRSAVPSLAALQDESVPLYEQVRAASSCQNEVILPWSQDTIVDPNFAASGKVYQEGPKGLVGLSGESRSGDANGQWFRVMLNSGNFAYPNGAEGFFLTTLPIMGVNPPPPPGNKRPPLKPGVPCETQEQPDLRTIPGPPPAGRKVRQSGPAYEARYAKARDAAVTWLRRQLEYEGLDDVLKVSGKDMTAARIKALGKSLGTVGKAGAR